MNEDLLISSYDYYLPEELIANEAKEPRDESRLMFINRKNDKIEHLIFKDIVNLLSGDELIVFNNTKVIPARLFGKKNINGANVEILLIRELEKDIWLCISKPAKRLKINTKIFFDKNLDAEVLDILENGERVIKFNYDNDNDFFCLLDKIGNIPIPPYIKQKKFSDERYQTIYSEKKGSVASPTAGLHFTESIFDKIKKKGIKIAFITLHIGLGTFTPVKTNNIKEHKMHEEYFEINKDTANILNEYMENNRRIIAVGTTAVRTLETAIRDKSYFEESKGFSDIFIYPGFNFKAVKSLITNFHLPKSTLLILVSAFWDRKKIISAYNIAIREKYRFYSLGDAMFIY
jgi:S-adenosylmethionine:tRNA ribosyltransferase-isomerase